MFALVIIDLEKKKVIISKDKLGLKPIFYYQDNDKFIFSSEIKAIGNYIGGLQIDYENSINSIFMAGRPPYGKTHFKKVNDLEQSSLIELDMSILK